ncbi:MAG TPA: TetR/AcrR family transcriptional regulator [Chitinophagaceae bacterium]|jgi:AcrR family transcriptional regulator|nr:TetR/AcrR family transcriptional regulator [Chitinophagaceae bacterium]
MKEGNGPRHRLLETASKLFYEQGYSATGINQILEEAGVAKASLYQHFGSKEELGLAYLQAQRESWFAALEAFAGRHETPAEQVLACFDFLEKGLQAHAFRGCRFINILNQIPEDELRLRGEVVAHKTKLHAFIKKRVLAARKGDGQAADTANTVYLLFEGAAVEARIFRQSWPVKAARRAAAALLG